MRMRLFVLHVCIWTLTVGLCLPVPPSAGVCNDALAPSHRAINIDQIAKIFSIVSKKIADKQKQEKIKDAYDRWSFLVGVFGFRPFLKWLESLSGKELELFLEVLPDLKSFVEEPAHVIVVADKLRGMQKSLRREELGQWAWVVSHQPLNVRRFGLAPFCDFADGYGFPGVLALATLAVLPVEIHSSYDLVMSACSRLDMVAKDTQLQTELRENLTLRRPLDRSESSCAKSLTRIEALAQKIPERKRKAQEAEQIASYKGWFDQKWADEMDAQFVRLRAGRLREWRLLEYIFSRHYGGIGREDLCAIILGAASRVANLPAYQERMDSLQERLFERLQWARSLEKFRHELEGAHEGLNESFDRLGSLTRGRRLGTKIAACLRDFENHKREVLVCTSLLRQMLEHLPWDLDLDKIESERRAYTLKVVPTLRRISETARNVERLLAELPKGLRLTEQVAPELLRIRWETRNLVRIVRRNKIEEETSQDTRLDLLMRQAFAAQDISGKIKSDVSGLQKVPGLPCSARRLQLVTAAILGNAATSVGAGDTLKASTRVFDDSVILEVFDSGVWMDNELDPVFFGHGWPLYGTANDATETALRTGAPLAMVRRTVEEMGGILELERERAQGTTVRIQFPLPGIQEAPRLPKEQVLVRYLAIVAKTHGRFVYPELVFSDGFWKITKSERRNRVFKETVERACPRVVDRDVLRRRMERFPRQDMSYWEFKNLMRVADWEDTAVLETFESLQESRGILSRLGSLFYEAYGAEVFRAKGGVPFKMTNDPVLMRAVAQKLYERLESVPSGETFLMHVWGFGGILDGIKSLAGELERLDRENKSRHADKLRCVASDKVAKMVEFAQAEAQTMPMLSDWVRRGILSFRTLDVMAPAKDIQPGSIDLVLSGYLYDSLPQRLIVQRKTNLYELKVRPVVKPNPVHRRNGEIVSWMEYRNMILNEDIKGLAELAPQSFTNIEFEHVLEPLDISKEPQLAEQLGDPRTWPNFSVVPMGEGMKKSIERTLPILKPTGEIWSFDDFIAKRNDLANRNGYHHYLGGVYATISGLVTEMQMAQMDVPVKIQRIGDWLQGHYSGSMANLDDLKRLDDLEARRYFPVQQMRNYQQIEALNQEILSGEGGYTPAGQKKFIRKLKTLMGPSFQIDKLDWGGLRTYLDDLQITIARKALSLQFRAQAIHDTLWIGENLPNAAFLNAAAGLGFDERIVQHLLSLRDELSARNIFSIMRIGPVGGKSEELWKGVKAAGLLGEAA